MTTAATPADIRAFVLARLAEEEAEALAEGHDDPDEGGYYACPVAQIAMFGKPADEESDGACTCGLERRREATLARVDALRALAEPHNPVEGAIWDSNSSGHFGDVCARCIWPKEEQEPWPCDVVKGVAAIWRSHPDWRIEWAL